MEAIAPSGNAIAVLRAISQAGFRYERTKELAEAAKTKGISRAAFDQKQNAFNVAKAKLEQQRMQYSWSRNQTGYTTLTADADGVITAVNAEVGQVVNVGQTVMKLARPEQKEVVINVPESRLAELQEAKEIAVSLWAMANRFYLGKVREVSPGVHLGIMHKRTKEGPKVATWFALDARGTGCCK